jgi:hypothetical protein
MANPFTTFRAAEHADTMEGFLSLVVPDPLEQYFERFFHDGVLFRRAMFVYGQPGSGKTTLARLFEPLALSTLLRNDSGQAFAAVRAAVARTGALNDDVSTIVGARIPLESDFRELANLPYSADVRRQLLLRLIQARAVLRWFAQLQQIGIKAAQVEAVPRDGFNGSMEVLGGAGGAQLLARARAVESSIYSILGALVPPLEKDFPADLKLPYHLFDVLAEFRIAPMVARSHNLETRLRPFVILDDAHALSAEQFQTLRSWVTRREIILGRWIMSRLDALSPTEIVSEFGATEESPAAPGVAPQRDFEVVALQGVGEDRQAARRQFRKVADAIGRRYLKQVEALNRAQIADLGSILDTMVTPLPDEKLTGWEKEVDSEAAKRAITGPVRRSLEDSVDAILKQRGETAKDLRVALLRILVHRRSTVRQLTLFGDDAAESPSLTVDASLIGAAEIQLFRTFGRPYFYGFDQLAMASSENPELFVRLAGTLVDASLNLLLRRKRPTVSAAEQHRLLRAKASEIVEQWNFPEASTVRRLVAGIASRCEKVTDLPNAYLKSGANAFGIPMADFNTLRVSNTPLAIAIKYGVAYSVFSVSLDRSVKNMQWCLVTLGGVACLHHRLTLALGGFVEGTATELHAMISPR